MINNCINTYKLMTMKPKCMGCILYAYAAKYYANTLCIMCVSAWGQKQGCATANNNR